MFALFSLILQGGAFSADASKTRVATDKAPHKGGDERRATTSPSSLQVEEIIGTDGKRTTTYPDGTVITLTPGPDPCWSMQASIAGVLHRQDTGRAYTKLQARAVTLGNPNDPLSLVTMTDTVSINGRNYTSVYTAASRTFTDTTPAGRQNFLTVDAQERVLHAQPLSILPVTPTMHAGDSPAPRLARSAPVQPCLQRQRSRLYLPETIGHHW